MSILKALQKKQTEQVAEVAEVSQANVVPFEKNGRRANQPPELLSNSDLKIGTPGSAFNGQSDSIVGMALPDVETKITAGATLNAVSLAPSASPRLPDFVEWNVEAERVEPRLVAITHPNSTYCEEYRSLRTHVLHKSAKHKLQSIVVEIMYHID
jgi:hypothetical protein